MVMFEDDCFQIWHKSPAVKATSTFYVFSVSWWLHIGYCSGQV